MLHPDETIPKLMVAVF